MMRNCHITVFGLLTGLMLCTEARAIVPQRSTERYASIPARNLFALKAPVPPQVTNPPPQLPRIILTGITTILGDKRALMLVRPPGSGPGQKELSLILAEGEAQDDIEVLQIDEKAGSVKVNNSGTIMTLTFEKDGPKLPNTPPPATKPVPPILFPPKQTPNAGSGAAASPRSR